MRLIKSFFLLLVLVVTLSALVGGMAYHYLTKPINITEPERYEVKKGVSSIRIGQQLAELGWIEHPVLTRIASKLDPTLVPKVGVYELLPSMNLIEVMALLDSGDTISYPVTLLEGKTYRDYLIALEDVGNIKMTLKGLSGEDIAQKMGLNVASPEGMLLANTYRYHDGDTDLDVFMRAHKLLVETLNSEWGDKAKGLPYATAYEALIMASIIEKETGLPSERPLISRVFVSRLKRGMRLQTDPTVIYGMGESYKGNITRRDLQKPTPYNTYTISGLPPTPIANIGYEAIHAALNPGETDALYFVAKGDGSHVFSKTLREHNAAVRDYQHRRVENYRSSPSQ